MDQGLSLSWTINRAKSLGAAYRTAFGLAVLVEMLVAFAALVAPLWTASLAGGMSGPPAVTATLTDWIRAWACMVLLFLLIQLPAPVEAPRKRWLNLAAVAGRLIQAIAYALLGFTWLAALEGILFVLLTVTLYRHMTAVLMSRP
jgi:hypothetical protein